MSDLYNIIKQLQNTSGSKDKQATLIANKDNPLLQRYLKATYNPQWNYYITEKTLPSPAAAGGNNFSTFQIDFAIEALASRQVSGGAAKQQITGVLETLTKEAQELFKMLLLKDVRANISEKTINKVWPDLIPVQPYKRCSLPSDVDLSLWPWATGVYSQVKKDGSYAVIGLELDGKPYVRTRAGNEYPLEALEEDLICANWVLASLGHGEELQGEFTIFVKGKELSRKKGNGLLNSVMQGGKLPEDHIIVFTAWDCVSQHNKHLKYAERFNTTCRIVDVASSNRVQVVETRIVYSKEEAMEHVRDELKKGKEGTVLKHPDGLWVDGTSVNDVKFKLECDVDLKIVGFEEGSGKYAGMLGCWHLESSCGKLKTGANATGTNAVRKAAWEIRESLLGMILVVTANDIIDSESKDTFALSLGRASPADVRWDKLEADDFERIKAIFDSAKGIV